MTQNSRQAIIELLFLAIYADDHVSLAENEVLDKAIEALGWESEQPREEFLAATFAAVKEAHADAAKEYEYFSQHAATIKAAGEQADALTWLTKVLAADGTSSEENYLISRLEKYWFE
jgi:uncharacterized tellurite resistance protein B-like protein